jgi:putative endonuclease
MAEFYVYILQNKEGLSYIGQTKNLDQRLSEHNDTSRISWASKRGPWTIIYFAKCCSRPEAMKKERFLKSLKNKSKLLSYIESEKAHI